MLYEKNKNNHQYILLRTIPYINDESELNAIILSSLRSMFGTKNPYDVTVIKCSAPSSNNDKYNTEIDIPIGEAILCSKASAIPYVKTALTLPHVPPYLN